MVKAKTAKEVFLMLVLLVISTGATSIPSMFQIHWGPPVWKDVLIRILCILVIVLLMALLLRYLLRKIQMLDAQDEIEEKAKGDTFDKAMQKHTDAIVTALQENSKAVIKAMREPCDGHE
jgi:type VI protein secretion system component VasK